MTEKIKRWLKRRAVVEPVIGHAKNDGLHGRTGDRCNTLLAASGFNLRQLLRFLKRMELFLRLFRLARLANGAALAACASLLSPQATHSILNAQNYSHQAVIRSNS